mmetsp:Transcript_25537/g.84388  ORF Transcript_25537/g.84388 Transcript_25537/m.84388 type:complete len:241 (+) Transcript_25537:568-1290(+)
MSFRPSLEEPGSRIDRKASLRVVLTDGALKGRDPQERFFQQIFLCKLQDRPVEADEDRDLDKRGKASCKRIDILRPVELSDLLVLSLRVVGISRLDGLDLGLQLLEGDGGRHLLEVERIGDCFHKDGEGRDGVSPRSWNARRLERSVQGGQAGHNQVDEGAKDAWLVLCRFRCSSGSIGQELHCILQGSGGGGDVGREVAGVSEVKEREEASSFCPWHHHSLHACAASASLLHAGEREML